jgi:fermentation-respiration switch protein FrsA (DUF1100 family)
MTGILITIGIIYFAVRLILGIAVWMLSSAVIMPKPLTLAETFRTDAEKGLIDPENFRAREKREISVISPYGYAMSATWLPGRDPAKAVIYFHGITWTRYGALKYEQTFRDLGYGALIVDLRYHGATGGKNCTFGFYEKHDARVWVDWLEGELGSGALIGTHGESLGAAVALQHAAIDGRVSFVVADCPFSDLRELLAYRMRWKLGPAARPLLALTDLAIALRTGGAPGIASALGFLRRKKRTAAKPDPSAPCPFRLKAVSPIADATRIPAPVLFIHGADDSYIPPAMSRAMHEARLSAGLESTLVLVPGARHAGSFAADPAGYRLAITAFLGHFHRG